MPASSLTSCKVNVHLHANSYTDILITHSYQVTYVYLVNVLPMEKKLLLHLEKQALPSTPEKKQHIHRSRPPRQTMVLAASVSFPSHGMQQARLRTQMSLSVKFQERTACSMVIKVFGKRGEWDPFGRAMGALGMKMSRLSGNEINGDISGG